MFNFQVSDFVGETKEGPENKDRSRKTLRSLVILEIRSSDAGENWIYGCVFNHIPTFWVYEHMNISSQGQRREKSYSFTNFTLYERRNVLVATLMFTI